MYRALRSMRQRFCASSLFPFSEFFPEEFHHVLCALVRLRNDKERIIARDRADDVSRVLGVQELPDRVCAAWKRTDDNQALIRLQGEHLGADEGPQQLHLRFRLENVVGPIACRHPPDAKLPEIARKSRLGHFNTPFSEL